MVAAAIYSVAMVHYYYYYKFFCTPGSIDSGSIDLLLIDNSGCVLQRAMAHSNRKSSGGRGLAASCRAVIGGSSVDVGPRYRCVFLTETKSSLAGTLSTNQRTEQLSHADSKPSCGPSRRITQAGMNIQHMIIKCRPIPNTSN